MLVVFFIFFGLGECIGQGVVDDVLIYCKICGENITTFSSVGTRFILFLSISSFLVKIFIFGLKFKLGYFKILTYGNSLLVNIFKNEKMILGF